MKEGIPQLSGPWGTAYFNELEQAVFRYAPPPPAERSAAGMQPLTVHRFGNASVAALACGDGRLYPLVSTEGHLVSLCGDPFVPPQVAGNRVFVMEGGLVHPVVGPDHPLSDRSDMICAATQLFASGIEGEVVTPDLAARCRVTVPLEGTPTLLVWMEVFNHSQGTRWVTLWNLWRFMPVVLESRFVRRVPLAHRLAAVVGMAGKELVDNGYFSLTTEGGGSRIQVSTSWDAANAELHWKGVRPVHVPPIQVVAMTRNIVLGASGIPQQLQSTLASETNRDSESGSAVLVSMRAAFEVRSQDRQVGAVAIHLADWDRAKAGLKRLLPFAMHRENEGIVHRKRFACSVERARQGQREVDRWQGVWQAAAAGALALTDIRCGGGTQLPPVGQLLKTDRQVPPRDQAVAALSLAFNSPALCVPMLGGLVSSAIEVIETFHGLEGRSGLVGEDLPWILWALAESDALLGWSSGRNPPPELRTFLEGVAALLALKELRGPHGLLVTAHADTSDVPHGPRGAAREAGNVETIAGSAMLMAACSVAARQFSAFAPGAAEELGKLSTLVANSLDALGGVEGHLPCWLLGDTAIGTGDLRPLQLAWLLLADRCPLSLRAGALEAARRMVAGGKGGPLPCLVDPDPSAPCGRVDLVENALLVAALARSEPALALRLFESLQPDARLRDRPGDWAAVFQPGTFLDPLPAVQTRPAVAAGQVWADALRAADGRGCAAVHLARCLLSGVAGVEGGFRLCIDLLDEVSLRSPLLSVLRTGPRIHGVWHGSAPERLVRLVSTRSGEMARWRVFKGTPAPDSGQADEVVFQIKSGESWGIELA